MGTLGLDPKGGSMIREVHAQVRTPQGWRAVRLSVDAPGTLGYDGHVWMVHPDRLDMMYKLDAQTGRGTGDWMEVLPPVPDDVEWADLSALSCLGKARLAHMVGASGHEAFDWAQRGARPLEAIQRWAHWAVAIGVVE